MSLEIERKLRKEKLIIVFDELVQESTKSAKNSSG